MPIPAPTSSPVPPVESDSFLLGFAVQALREISRETSIARARVLAREAIARAIAAEKRKVG
jgi:hypothetical protein